MTSEKRVEIDTILLSIQNMDIPILDIQNKVGHTDYIDFIGYNQITHPIMKGIDCYNRPFFVIRGPSLRSSPFLMYFRRKYIKKGLLLVSIKLDIS